MIAPDSIGIRRDEKPFEHRCRDCGAAYAPFGFNYGDPAREYWLCPKCRATVMGPFPEIPTTNPPPSGDQSFGDWIKTNPPPDLQELIARFGGYNKIVPEAWAGWDAAVEAWQAACKARLIRGGGR
jgi:hypothetical protein